MKPLQSVSMGTIFFVRTVVETLERSGTSRAELLARTGLDSACLDEPKAWLEVEECEQVLASAVALTGDEAFGLHLAEQMPVLSLDLFAHVTALAPTLREAVAIGAQFARLAIDGARLTAHDEGDTLVVRCAFPRVTPLWDRTFAEFAMAGLARLARAFGGDRIFARRTSFEHERPSDDREYTRILGDHVRFRESETCITFARELADRRRLQHHPDLYSVLRAEAERRIDRIATGERIAAQLHRYLVSMSPACTPGMGRAARDLGMSERSLRWHLAAEGTSYREVLQSALEASADRMLRDPTRSITETAAALGFGDAPAFTKAFKRWTGTTPGKYRRARRVR